MSADFYLMQIDTVKQALAQEDISIRALITNVNTSLSIKVHQCALYFNIKFSLVCSLLNLKNMLDLKDSFITADRCL